MPQNFVRIPLRVRVPSLKNFPSARGAFVILIDFCTIYDRNSETLSNFLNLAEPMESADDKCEKDLKEAVTTMLLLLKETTEIDLFCFNKSHIEHGDRKRSIGECAPKTHTPIADGKDRLPCSVSSHFVYSDFQ